LCDSLVARGQECNLILIQVQEGFFVAVRIAMLGGFVLAFPVIATQLWRFVAPGLYRSEKNAFLPFILASPMMFFLGAAFAFYVVTPLAFTFFLGLPATRPADRRWRRKRRIPLAQVGIAFQGSVNEYLSLTTRFIIAFGLCFQLAGAADLDGQGGLVSAAGSRRGGNGRWWGF
jgi:sec-independent protein translocase protein TatC